MSEQIPTLPPLYFATSGKYTYARTYHNVWVPKKNGSGKIAVKENSDLLGVTKKVPPDFMFQKR